MPREAIPHYLYDGYDPKELKGMRDEFFRKWLSQHSIPDEQLYHYTDARGMQGILRERGLWLSDVTSFNDPDEIEYGKRIALNILHRLETEEDFPPARKFLGGMRPFIESFGKVDYGVFVVCFCAEGNLLSQWRGYSERACGYSLGFNFSENTEASLNGEDLTAMKDLFFRKVIYCETEQRKWIQSYLQSAIEVVRQKAPTLEEACSISLTMVDAILDMLLCFKHEAFAEEKEWRLLRVTRRDHEPENVKIRESCGLMVPYRPLVIFNVGDDGMAKFPIGSIMCGPALEFERARSGLNQLLHQFSNIKSPIQIVPDEIEIKEPGYTLRLH